MPKALTKKQQQIKERFTKERGYWSEAWDPVLRLDPNFFEAYFNFSAVPWRTGSLSPKLKEFMYIAADASATHLFNKGTQQHIANALKYGATRQEIMEIFELISLLGIHTCVESVPILVEEAELVGKGISKAPLTKRQQELKAKFTKERGYWSPVWEPVLRIDPDFFEAYSNFSFVPWQTGVLDPKVKELVYIACDAQATHLYNLGTRVHIKNALKYGATIQEIMEVFELVSLLGIHTCVDSVPLLVEEADKAKAK